MAKLCDDTHICMECFEECICGTYEWACPWKNDDENQICDWCMDKYDEEYDDFVGYLTGDEKDE